MFKFLALTFLLLTIGTIAESGQANDEDISKGGALRQLQAKSTRWRSGFVDRGVYPGYTFSRNTGDGFKDTLTITNYGQLLMETDGSVPPAVIFGNDWQINGFSGNFDIHEHYGNVVFRIKSGAPFDSLRINEDGSIHVESGIVAGVNIPNLEERLRTFENAITIQDNGTVSFPNDVSVQGRLELSGESINCPPPVRRLVERDDFEGRLGEFEGLIENLNSKNKEFEALIEKSNNKNNELNNENNELRAMVKELSNRVKSLEKK